MDITKKAFPLPVRLEFKKTVTPPALPQPIRERLSLGVDRPVANSRAILERIGPQRLERYERECIELSKSSDPTWVRLRRLYDLVEEVATLVRPNAACHRGCFHCCQCAVEVTRTEAQMIGVAIGRKPKKAPERREYDSYGNFKGFVWGPSNPCTFLIEGQCSIYENRPLRCRTHYSVDVDNTLCVPSYPLTWDTYLFNMQVFIGAYAVICGGAARYRAADIRDYFPKKDGTDAP
jgi:Fe-S-cluster containining protein